MSNFVNPVTNSDLLYGSSGVSDSYKKHLASMWESLEHRIAVARSNQNTELLAMLEREKSAISPYQVTTKMIAPVNPVDTLWQGLRSFLFPKSEIIIRQISDRAGNQWWYAYNPITGQSIYADNDSEMRMWLDQQAL